ncbi:MAG: YncE family protein [Bacteroidia bacterium]
MKKNALICLLALSVACFNNLAGQNSHYKLEKKIGLEGNGGWDYLVSDDSTGLLYVSHGMIVNVVNAANGQTIGTIPDTKGVHGIALAKDLNKGFISCGKDTSVVVFDLSTLSVITRIKVTGQNPDAILYDTFSKNVFVYNGRSSNATVIDARSNAVIETIALPGKPEFSVSDGQGKVYVNIEDKSKICMINSSTLKLEKTWDLGKGKEPSGLALDNKNHRLFSVCGNKLMIILDATSGKQIARLPIGESVDGAAFDPDKERAYSSNGDGTLTVIQGTNGKDYKVLETVATQKGARTITLNRKTHHIFLSCARFGETPPSTNENPHPRPQLIPGSFTVLDIETLN